MNKIYEDMKRLYVFAIAFLCAAAAIADSLTVRMSGPQGYEVISISKNGKYATLTSGSDGAVWDLENDAVTYFTDADGNETFAYGVSDDGVVAGIFVFEGLDDTNGAAISTGGVYKDGQFYHLQDEDGGFVETTAMGISPDGKIVCGTVNESSWKVYPALWNADGTMIRRLDTEDGSYGSANYVTNDTVAGGWYYHSESSGRTNRQVCYWKSDGTLVWLGADEDDVSGMYNFYGFSEDGLFGICAFGTEDEDADIWMRGCVIDMTDEGSIWYETPTSNVYQVINGGIALINGYNDDTGIADAELAYSADSVMLMEDYIADVFGSELDSDLDGHLFTAYMADDGMTVCGTSYTADGSNLVATCWRRLDALSDVTSFSCSPLSGINDKVYLRWGQPLVNYDNLTNYVLYYLSTSGEWTHLTDIEGDLTSLVADVPEDNDGTTLTYKITALYDDEESSGVTATADLTDVLAPYAAAPSDIYGYVYNYNDVSLTWAQAYSGASANLGWYSGTLGYAFGATSEMTFIAAVQYNADVIEVYRNDFTLTGAELYFNAPVDSMVLLVYSNEEIIAEQPVNQSALNYYSYNVIELDEPLTLPSSADVMIAFRVIQTTTGAPLNLDGGPAVEGGDLISEDDGVTWTTMRELSEGAYDYNWVISMVLASNSGNANLEEYIVYRDSTEIGTVAGTDDELFNITDMGVTTGSHSYTISTVWDDGSTATSEACSIYVSDRDASRCPAPVNVEATVNEDEKTMALTWEMPRQSELTYSNWTYSGAGTTITGYTAWMQGVLYDIPAMKPYIGAAFTKVSFYPISDCDLAIHIFRDGEEVGYMDVENYTLDTMNTITLDEPVQIEAGYEYMVMIEGYDIAENTAFLGNDNAGTYGKNVITYDDGENFYTDTEYTTSNYMIGVMIQNDEDNSDADVTYAVYIDSTKTAENISQTAYTVSTSDISSSSVNVNIAAVYSIGESLSDDLSVALTASGINTITTEQNSTDNETYSLEGKRLTSAQGKGIYIIKNNNGAKKIILK